MSTLTHRYITAVGRAVPESQRQDVEAEVAAAIADLTQARLESGSDPQAAEQEVLVELGDPMRLAAGYANKPLHLIGPDHFPAYVRLLKVLASTVLPVVTCAVILGQIISGADAAEVVVTALATLWQVALMMAFWVTVVFAAIERTPGSKAMSPQWNPSMLPDPPAGHVKLGDTVASVTMSLIGAAYLIWQNFRSPFTDAAGEPIPTLAPGLWSLWIPLMLAGLLASAVLEVLRYRAGGWSWGFVAANAAADLVFTVPLIWLAATNTLVEPRFTGKLVDLGWVDAGLHLNTTIIVIAVGVLAWELIDSIRKVRGDTTARNFGHAGR